MNFKLSVVVLVCVVTGMSLAYPKDRSFEKFIQKIRDRSEPSQFGNCKSKSKLQCTKHGKGKIAPNTVRLRPPASLALALRPIGLAALATDQQPKLIQTNLATPRCGPNLAGFVES